LTQWRSPLDISPKTKTKTTKQKNNMNTSTKKLQHPEELKAAVISTVEPFRVQALRIVAMVGAFITAAGMVDFTGVASILPADIAAWLLIVGPLLMGSEKGLLVLGDYLDNGKRDNSFKLPAVLLPFLLLGVFSVLTVSCVDTSFRFTPDGCALVDYEKDGKTYSAGGCFDAEGKVTVYRVEWLDNEGRLFQADRQPGTDAFVVRYRQAADSLWIIWDKDSGIAVDLPPAIVEVESTK